LLDTAIRLHLFAPLDVNHDLGDFVTLQELAPIRKCFFETSELSEQARQERLGAQLASFHFFEMRQAVSLAQLAD